MSQQSPCYQCDNMGGETYPICSGQCAPLNAYLVEIGDLPHKKPDANLHLLYPPAIKQQSKDLCSKDEYAVVAKYVKKYQKRTGLTGRQISQEIGCIPELINSITRDNQQRMTKAKYKLFVEWMEGKR